MSGTCLFTFNWSNFFPTGNTFLPCIVKGVTRESKLNPPYLRWPYWSAISQRTKAWKRWESSPRKNWWRNPQKPKESCKQKTRRPPKPVCRLTGTSGPLHWNSPPLSRLWHRFPGRCTWSNQLVVVNFRSDWVQPFVVFIKGCGCQKKRGIERYK